MAIRGYTGDGQEFVITAIYIPCPHCTMWRSPRPGNIGEAKCPGCGSMVTQEEWKDSWMSLAKSVDRKRNPDDPWAVF